MKKFQVGDQVTGDTVWKETGGAFAEYLMVPEADERLLQVNSKSDLLYRIGNNGKPGLSPGMFVSPHSIAYDSFGNIYVGDVVETDWDHIFGNKVKPSNIRRFQRFIKTGMWKEFTK